MGSGRATIADVARAAGVAPSTASVVFSGKAHVAESTKARVLRAAAELGYAGPDPRAASLRRGRSGIVGVVFGTPLGSVFVDPVNAQVMDGLADGVAELGAGLLLLRDHDPTGRGATLLTAPIDAAVLVGCSALLRDSLAEVRARRIPLVVMEGDAGEGIPRIELDNFEAQRQAARHLRALGHEHVAIITLRTSPESVPGQITAETKILVDVTADRLAGAREVFPNAPAYSVGGSSIDEGLAAGRVLFADRRNAPTAVIAQSDLIAAGVIRAAEAAGLRVPDDVSVTGFDGVGVDGLSHRLTTLVQPTTDKGLAAGRAVAALLGGCHAASIRFTCEFRLGNTTAPAPARGQR